MLLTLVFKRILPVVFLIGMSGCSEKESVEVKQDGEEQISKTQNKNMKEKHNKEVNISECDLEEKVTATIIQESPTNLPLSFYRDSSVSDSVNRKDTLVFKGIWEKENLHYTLETSKHNNKIIYIKGIALTSSGFPFVELCRENCSWKIKKDKVILGGIAKDVSCEAFKNSERLDFYSHSTFLEGKKPIRISFSEEFLDL
jgi:hypothetical protein